MTVYDYLLVVSTIVFGAFVYLATSCDKDTVRFKISATLSALSLVSAFVFAILSGLPVDNVETSRTIIVYNENKEVIDCYTRMFAIDENDDVVTLSDKDGYVYYISSKDIE